MRALPRLDQSIKSPAPAQRTSPRPRDQNALFPFVLISHSRAPVHEDLPGCRQSVLHAQAYDQLSPPNSQMIRMIGNGIPISQSNNPRPMVRSIITQRNLLFHNGAGWPRVPCSPFRKPSETRLYPGMPRHHVLDPDSGPPRTE